MNHIETVKQCFEILAQIWAASRPLDSFNSQYSGDPERFHTLGIMQMWCEYFIAQFEQCVEIEGEDLADAYATVKFEYTEVSHAIAAEMQAAIDAQAAADAAAAAPAPSPYNAAIIPPQ